MTTSTQSPAPIRNHSRLWSAAKIVVFDIAAPLAAYSMLRSAGLSVVSALGLLSGNARLMLVEGSVPTAVFGLLCLASLRSRRPLIFRFALEFMGPDTPRGQDFAGLWQYYGFR